MISHRLCRISALRRDFLLVTWAFGGEERIVSLLATVIQKMIYSKQRGKGSCDRPAAGG
jgi:hypothetical protein